MIQLQFNVVSTKAAALLFSSAFPRLLCAKSKCPKPLTAARYHHDLKLYQTVQNAPGMAVTHPEMLCQLQRR
jgi:hypothetical protein